MNISSKIFYLLLAFPLAFTACGEDDEENNGGSETVNVNANGTDKSQYETRIEVPHVDKGNNYLFLAKTTQDFSDGVNYIVEWDCINHAQRWTCWKWDETTKVKNDAGAWVFKNWDRNNWDKGSTFNGYGGNGDPFQPDTEIPAEYRTELSDYSGSGYNRGHMCASEDRIASKEVNGQTFYLSNMHPQIYAFNGYIWSTMESRVRNWRDAVVNAGGVMYICKGGTIGDVTIDGKTSTGVVATIGSKKIPVPKYFFMAILKKTASGLYSGMAFWAEHKADSNTNLTPYMISIDELESRTGIDFFCNLPDNIENATEANLTTSEWK